MKLKALISLVTITCLIIAGITGSTGCANIVPPQGGPRDSLPPRLVRANPKDSAINFRNRTLTLEFDEFIDVQNPQSEMIITPTPINFPTVDYRLNTVTVKLKDSLESNTTYSFNFGKSIKDINEGNIMKDFTYIFSTGPYIDSLEYSGKVLLAETGKIDSTLIVILHSSSDDSAIVNEKPRYVTKLDSRGNFTFKNLPARTFYLYALKDEGGSRRYNENQLFAFADSPIVVGQTKPDTLFAYSGRPLAQSAGASLLPNIGNRNRPATTGTDRRLRYTTSLTSGQQDLLGEYSLNFEQPLRSFDPTKITLKSDTTFTTVANYRFIQDSTRKKVELIHTWKENTAYHVILDKDFAEDSAGRKLLKSDTLSFRTRKLSDYASLKLSFRNLNLSKNPVLQFVQSSTVLRSFPLTDPVFTQSIFLPGEYELRILFDDNKNGKWDPGEFFGKHKQPELVKPVDRRITIKAGSENDIEIAL
jgi:hypothetical protein